MIAWKLKLWRTAGAAAALGLAACGGEGGRGEGEAGETAAHGEAGEALPPAPAGNGEAGEAAIGEAGGEHGEAGVADAYAGVAGPQRTALRLQHLKGFVLIAQRVAGAGDAESAQILVRQGLLEVFEPASEQFGALDMGPVRAASEAASNASLSAALDALARAGPTETDHAALAVSMTDIASGLYRGVIQDGFVDPIEYQHSFGAALAAREALAAGRESLRSRNARVFDEGLRELDRLIALWPAAAAPERPTTYRDVLAQASRVRLALSPLL